MIQKCCLLIIFVHYSIILARLKTKKNTKKATELHSNLIFTQQIVRYAVFICLIKNISDTFGQLKSIIES